MKEPNCPINTLSQVMPEASHATIKNKLDTLRQLIIECEKAADELSQIIAQLRHVEGVTVFSSVAANKTFLEKTFKKSGDVIFFKFVTFSGVKVLIVYIEGLISKEILGRDIINAFIMKSKELPANTLLDSKIITTLVTAAGVIETQTMAAVIDDLLNGNTVLFVDGVATAFLIESKGWEKRTVAEPDTESVIRGPREGFIENIRTNTSLLRRKIKNPNLVFENISLGKQTNTNIAIAYIAGIVNQAVLGEVRRRLNKIDADSILETGYIEQFIEDSPFSPLATIANTQKPDILAAKLLEGRVAIFCDGTPHVLTVPHLLVETLQTSEDYYVRPFIASMWRIIRLTALFFSIFVPGLYVALQTYHQEMIPTILLLRMAGSISDIPFPAGAEMLIMVVFYELLRESGVRLPRAVGSAISIIGALIVGESAVNAGLVSAPVVIVTAVTGVAGFIVPALSEAIMFYRFLFLIAGSVMGLYGVVCGLFLIVLHAVSLRSFGVPYTSSLAPSDQGVFMDFYLRFPLWAMKKRPAAIAKDNQQRRGDNK
ncbi:Spore germination protein B1 [Sporomusa ovata DSM 2662]|uniref:Spore germination protein GerKA n=1 Tax=Sporomusa ovata TaxID=2378 RepID=A0A0U1KTE5_9FIRM|nr:spore germination protein [Sporomusa ovata]EQB26597.1 spore germination protein KA [Sporomusa ovata DSM 2662]CQR70686.1 Spore germination protein GerKA [Sporomusa ovata]